MKRQSVSFLAVLALLLVFMPAARRAESAYTPTMRDMMSINATLHRYVMGLDKHNGVSLASAFAPDGALMLYVHGQLITNVHGRAGLTSFGAGTLPAGPTQPTGSSTGSAPPASPALRDIFHFVANDYYDFHGPALMKHYAYWMDVRPGDGNTSTIGTPGHYEDVFVKRDGEWYIQERKIFVGDK